MLRRWQSWPVLGFGTKGRRFIRPPPTQVSAQRSQVREAFLVSPPPIRRSSTRAHVTANRNDHRNRSNVHWLPGLPRIPDAGFVAVIFLAALSSNPRRPLKLGLAQPPVKKKAMNQ